MMTHFPKKVFVAMTSLRVCPCHALILTGGVRPRQWFDAMVYRTLHTHGTSEKCRGCGVSVQSDDSSLRGYVPFDSLIRFRDGWRKTESYGRGVAETLLPSDIEISNKYTGHTSEYKSKQLYCRCCYRLQQYGSHEPYDGRWGISNVPDVGCEVRDLVEKVNSASVVVSVVDILDFESSVVPELYEALSRKGIPVITILNKCDCLPLAVNRWNMVSRWGQMVSKSLRSAVGPDGKHDVIPVSSSTDEGFDLLENRLKVYSERHKNIVVMGRVNSGKSSFVTRFLRYVGHNHLGCVHYKRGVGGLTRAPVPFTTKDFMSFALPNGYKLVDTPGVSSHIRVDPYLMTGRDFFDVALRRKIQPTTLSVREGRALLVGALCRLHVQSGSSATMTCFFSSKVTLHVCADNTAEDLLKRKAGIFFYPPHVEDSEDHNELRVMQHPWICHRVKVYCSPTKAKDDIVVPGLGWVSVYGHGHKVIDVWVPEGVKVFRRPSLMPLQIHKSPTTPHHFRKRARSLHINMRKKRLIQTMRNQPGDPSTNE